MEERIVLHSTPGARRAAKRVGRGGGSNRGSTCGRGDKGQNSRSGGGVRAGFEGGQMPIKRRLPKRGFRSRKAGLTGQVRTCDLQRFADQVVDLELLKTHKLVAAGAQQAKIVVNGELSAKVTVKGIRVSAGARSAIEAASGAVEE